MFTKKFSPIWEYFTILGDCVAICEICDKKLSYKTSSDNLRKHLEKKHSTFFLNCDQEVESQEKEESEELPDAVVIEGPCEVPEDNYEILSKQVPQHNTKQIIASPTKEGKHSHRREVDRHQHSITETLNRMSHDSSCETVQKNQISFLTRTVNEMKHPSKRHTSYVPFNSGSTLINSGDQFNAFGAHIVEELKLISDVHSLRVAKMKIQQVIFEAQSGYYEKEKEREKSTTESNNLTELIAETVSEDSMTVVMT